jgi:hypothetical protein
VTGTPLQAVEAAKPYYRLVQKYEEAGARSVASEGESNRAVGSAHRQTSRAFSLTSLLYTYKVYSNGNAQASRDCLLLRRLRARMATAWRQGAEGLPEVQTRGLEPQTICQITTRRAGVEAPTRR